MSNETSQLIQAVTDEFYGLHCDIGRLEQENTRLRELIYDRAHDHAIQHMTEDELRITLANALDENAKLRGLLLKSYESFEEVYNRCDIDDPWRMETALEDMRVCMRELGVEKDNGELWLEVDK